MSEKHPESEPIELFTLLAHTSKRIKNNYFHLLDVTNKEFRATRAEAIVKAKAYFDAINSTYKSVTLFVDTIKAGKPFGRIVQTKIFNQETL